MRGSESGYIVRGPRLRATDDANAILREAEQGAGRVLDSAQDEAARIRSQAESEAAALCDEARSRGRDEAAVEAAALMADVSTALDLFWREREAELRDLALALAYRILTSLPQDELLVRLATEALAEHGRDTRLSLKTSADMTDRVRAALVELGVGDRVTVSADPSLATGECTLLHPQGRTEVGLVAQFRSLMGAVATGASERVAT